MLSIAMCIPIAAAGAATVWAPVNLPTAQIGDELRARVAEQLGMQEVQIKYRDGNARLDADSLNRVLRGAEAGFERAAGLQRVQRTSTGMDVIRADRRLGEGEALTLLRTLARNPQVEYAITYIRSRGAANAVAYSEIWASSEYDGEWSDRWSVSR